MADLIDRGELLKSLYEDCKCMNSHFLAAVRLAPAVNRWIPCSSQLPDEDTDVMIYVETELFLNTSVARLIGGTWFEYSILSGLRQLDGFEVLAWMPLPNPPKEVNDAGHS